jgi:hypothetical protein
MTRPLRFEDPWVLLLGLAALAAAGCSPAGLSEAQSAKVYEAAAASRVLPGAPVAPPTEGAKPPERMDLARLEGRWSAAPFGHAAHAHMARPGPADCAICHHHQDVGAAVPACGRCHTAPLDEETAGRLGLKGAYHHQCLDCHRTLGEAAADCRRCHLPRNSPGAGAQPAIPRRAVPSEKTYRTPHDGGTEVRFDHGNHADACEGGCAGCHGGERCAACHGAPASPPVKAADPHAKCNACHGKDRDMEFECSDCHGK